MSKEGTIMLCAVVVAVSPFVGLSYSWLMWLLPILGLVMFSLALSLRVRRQRARMTPPTPPIHEEEPVV